MNLVDYVVKYYLRYYDQVGNEKTALGFQGGFNYKESLAFRN